MYQFLEACLVVVLCACLLWAVAFGVTVDGTHYELVCASGCKLVVKAPETRRLNLARRAAPEHPSSASFPH